MLERPEQIDEDAVLDGLLAGRIADPLGVHVTNAEGERIGNLIRGYNLVTADIGTALEVISEIIVIQTAPNGGRLDALVIIRELPISLQFGTADDAAKVIGLVFIRWGSGVISVFSQSSDWEAAFEAREGIQGVSDLAAPDDRIEALARLSVGACATMNSK